MVVPRGLTTSVVCCLAIAAGAIAGYAQGPAAAGTASGEAAAVLSAARDALGGENRLANVKTIAAQGRTRQVQGDNLVPIEFDISIELPDKYVRTDEIPARESGPTSRGFNRDGLIQFPDAPPGGARGNGPAPPPPGATATPPPAGASAGASGRAGGGPPAPPSPVIALKQDFVRLTLGMFAASFTTYPLTFSYAGQAEAPKGKADVIDVKGPANFAARLFVDSKTHLPLMLSWQAPVVLGPVAPGQPPPAALPPESRIYYADYRDVDGMKFPFRLRRAIGAVTTEETTFDRFRINSKIDPRKFEARK